MPHFGVPPETRSSRFRVSTARPPCGELLKLWRRQCSPVVLPSWQFPLSILIEKSRKSLRISPSTGLFPPYFQRRSAVPSPQSFSRTLVWLTHRDGAEEEARRCQRAEGGGEGRSAGAGRAGNSRVAHHSPHANGRKSRTRGLA
eukprot:scaffold407_cov251-Pinguiococcus_pyrenoidosus.AAC.1